MTLTEHRNNAKRLANGCFVRWWTHFTGQHAEPQVLALCCIQVGNHGRVERATLYERDMLKLGYRKETREGLDYWLVERTDDDGNTWTPLAL